MLKPFWLHPGKVLRGLNSLRMGTGMYGYTRLNFVELGKFAGEIRKFAGLYAESGMQRTHAGIQRADALAYFVCLALQMLTYTQDYYDAIGRLGGEMRTLCELMES